MIARGLRLACLLAAAVSSSTLLSGADALPQARSEMMEARDHHHHHHHHNDHHHHSHEWDSSRTKVYADDPLIVSGDGNHVHAHLDKRRHRHHWDHHEHHEHKTKVYADDPLVVSGDGNHVHVHSHKRGLVDPLVPLLGAVPGIPGVIDLVDMVSHTVLSEKLASLIISPKPAGASTESTNDDNSSGFVISASNMSSSVMYLLPQNTSVSFAPPEQRVLIMVPMFHEKEKGLKMYCASYDPSPSAPIQLSPEPCVTVPVTDGNTTTPHTSQLFSWDQQSGEITPLWNEDSTRPVVDTTSAPGGGAEPTIHASGDGFVVGQPVFSTGGQSSSGKVAMIFRAAGSPASSSSITSNEVPATDLPSSTQPATETAHASATGTVNSASL